MLQELEDTVWDAGGKKKQSDVWCLMAQCPTRGLFQILRREWELLSLNIVFRDENENFSISISCFETKQESLFSIWGFQMRRRIEIKKFSQYIWECNLMLVHRLIFSKKKNVNYLIFRKIIGLFKLRILNENLFFNLMLRDKN